MPFSGYLAESILNWVRGTAFPQPPTGLYLSLHDGEPGEDGLLADRTAAVLGPGGRAFLDPSFLGAITAIEPVGRKSSLTGEVILTVRTVNTEVINLSHWGIWNTAQNGQLLYRDAMSRPLAAPPGVILKLEAGQFEIQVERDPLLITEGVTLIYGGVSADDFSARLSGGSAASAAYDLTIVGGSA